MVKRPQAPWSAPTASSLRDAALAYLAKFSSTEQSLRQVLVRKLDRWARQSDLEPELLAARLAEGKQAVTGIVARLVASGAVSDAVFAEGRARSLSRTGRSQRAIAAHLAAKGVAPALIGRAASNDDERDLSAAFVHARKRRIGPFRASEETPEIRRRELASFARAGFSNAIASRVRATSLEEAESRIIAFRSAEAEEQV